MTAQPPQPDPSETTGLTAGGQTREGDTPPIEDSMSGAAENVGTTPNQAPAKSGRGPMIITIIFIALITIPVLIYGVAEIASYVGG